MLCVTGAPVWLIHGEAWSMTSQTKRDESYVGRNRSQQMEPKQMILLQVSQILLCSVFTSNSAQNLYKYERKFIISHSDKITSEGQFVTTKMLPERWFDYSTVSYRYVCIPLGARNVYQRKYANRPGSSLHISFYFSAKWSCFPSLYSRNV